jgi:predicted MFS family arabinose efflux permease
MLNCVAGIAGSIYLGKLLDKKRNYKAQQIMIGLAVAVCILLTFVGLHF